MADDLTGRAGGGESGPASHRLPAAPSAAVRVEPTSDRKPEPAAVKFAQLLDGEWLHWSVVEVDARAVPGARGARCLIFTRHDCIRRVWDYPADWRTLDETGLAALTWHR